MEEAGSAGRLVSAWRGWEPGDWACDAGEAGSLQASERLMKEPFEQGC